MHSIPLNLLLIIILALLFDFINGFHDTANAIATSVSTRVLTPRAAIFMSAVFNFFGAMINTEVAKTIGHGIVDPKFVTEYLVLAAVIAAIVWDLITWWWGIPSSSSHAIIGGLIGAAIVTTKLLSDINWIGFVKKIVLPLIISPVLGFIFGYLFMMILYVVFARVHPNIVNRYFSKLQIFSAMWMAYSHGSNDAQKSMGIITMALVSAGVLNKFVVPDWVKFACALAMALGTSFGGWRIIKTMGVKIIKLAPINGFAAETGAALTIQFATHIGAPVSTTHVISSSIMGVGACKKFSAVRWGIAKNIVIAWILTIPMCSLIGGLIAWIIIT
ncbi:inorganic phosphate transporter [Caldicellulosiruptor morganii]|uniref:Inorganic phosphate transporter n=1 Tax=Caldicellulosiruptor morganii TaxID=1387555 RepID=A0ABY7BSQ7_9FIRM|nr:inorganic phosphate transporter [Caldicellulosiruptor morganii]WAM34821.1 inorganic phosphate transporter [Caldicellulosiruptor morganii]